MKVVLRGEIGAGKTTVVREAMRRLGWAEPAGFFTHWAGAERGAEVLHAETWAGVRRPMARRMGAPALPGGSPYRLEEDFARIAIASFSGADPARPVVIDELGAIELGSAAFAAAVAELFRGPAPVLAVIQRRALDRWMERIGRERVTHLLDVDPVARAGLSRTIAALFRA